MYAVYDGEKAIGFVSLSKLFEKSYELHVLGLLPDYHRKGLGKKLISYAENQVKKMVEFILM